MAHIAIRGWVGRREVGKVGGGREWVGSQRQVLPSIRIQTALLCLQEVTETDSINRIGQDSRWQQSGTTHDHILINVTHWLHRPCSAP